MNEHKEFDDYVKGLFETDPKVPTELDWESMDFDLPKPVAPEKKSWRRFLWLLLLPLLFGTCSLGYFYFGNNKALPISEVSQMQTNLETKNVEIERNKFNSESTNDNTDELILDDIKENTNLNSKSLVPLNETQDANSLSTESKTNTDVEIIKPSHKLKNETLNTPALSENYSTAEKFRRDDSINGLEHVSPQNVFNSSNNTILFSTENVEVVQNVSSSVVEDNKNNDSNPTMMQLNLLPILTPNFEIKNRNDQLNIKYFNPVDQASYSVHKINDQKFKLDAIYLGYGYSQLDAYEADSIGLLETYVNTGLGQTFYVGVRMSLNRRLKANLKLNYDRLHTTFDHTFEFEPIFDEENNTLTYRKEITHHNNYTNVLGLNVGVEARTNRIGKFEGFLGFGFTPSYVLSTFGKTLTERGVEQLIFDSTENKFSLMGEAAIGLDYLLSRNISIGLTAHFNRTLYNPIFINNRVFTKQQQKISLSLGYRF